MKYLLILLLFSACGGSAQSPTTEGAPPTQPQQAMIEQDTNFTDVMTLTKSEALATYGEATEQESYSLEEMQGEFWNGIQDAFTEAEKAAEDITIDELTWKKDAETNITVWYHREGGNRPRAHLEWAKGAEF